MVGVGVSKKMGFVVENKELVVLVKCVRGIGTWLCCYRVLEKFIE